MYLLWTPLSKYKSMMHKYKVIVNIFSVMYDCKKFSIVLRNIYLWNIIISSIYSEGDKEPGIDKDGNKQIFICRQKSVER